MDPELQEALARIRLGIESKENPDFVLLRKYKYLSKKKLREIKPVWIQDVEASLKYSQPYENFLGTEFELIRFNLENLRNRLHAKAAFPTEKLWGHHNDIKSAKVLDGWKNGVATTLPILFATEQSNGILIADGNHRLACSIFLLESEIDIVVPIKFKIATMKAYASAKGIMSMESKVTE